MRKPHGPPSTLLLVAVLAASASGAPPAAPATAPPSGAKFPLPEQVPKETTPVPPVPSAADATAARGRVVVRAVQGTPEGPAIAGVPVALQLVHRGAAVQSLEAALDDDGLATFEDLPVGIGVLPVVRIDYAGVTYQQPGEAMDATRTEQAIEVTCYEVTTDAPAWSIESRHVMVDRAPGGLRVAEIVVIENPSPHTWIGSPGADPQGRPCTSQVPLPPGAMGISLGRGFHDWCCTSVEHGRLVNHLPMMPEVTELRFGYVIPADQRGAVAIELSAPTDVGSTMVVFPDDLRAESAQGLSFGGTDDTGEQRVQYYQTGAQERGGTVRLVLTGLDAAPRGPAGAGPATKVVAAVAAVLLLIVAAVIIVSRSARAGSTP